MTKDKIIETFKALLDKDQISAFTPAGATVQGVNYEIVNAIPQSTSRLYFKIETLSQAKEIWIAVLSDFPKEKKVDQVFDKNLPVDLDTTKELFFCIYTGKK